MQKIVHKKWLSIARRSKVLIGMFVSAVISINAFAALPQGGKDLLAEVSILEPLLKFSDIIGGKKILVILGLVVLVFFVKRFHRRLG